MILKIKEDNMKKKPDNKLLASKLGFKSAREMLFKMGYSDHKLADLKAKSEEEKRIKQDNKLKELILNYYNVDAMALVELLEDKIKITQNNHN